MSFILDCFVCYRESQYSPCVLRSENVHSTSILEAIKGIETNFNNKSKNKSDSFNTDCSQSLSSGASTSVLSERYPERRRQQLQSESWQYLNSLQPESSRRQSYSDDQNWANPSISQDLGATSKTLPYSDVEMYKPFATRGRYTEQSSHSLDGVDSDTDDDDDYDFSDYSLNASRNRTITSGKLPPVRAAAAISRNQRPRYSHLL